jgi:16S rRNA C967 or C1407 C5-methylase (RsmB/RsmF family)
MTLVQQIFPAILGPTEISGRRNKLSNSIFRKDIPCPRTQLSPKSKLSHYFSREAIHPRSRGQFRLDSHIPDLLIFHPDHKLHHDEAYKDGRMIAQDKASCFPAVVLDPPKAESAWVIDATAAPGNKVSPVRPFNDATYDMIVIHAYRHLI